MKRFYKEVSVAPADGGWQVQLDERGIKTPAKNGQIVPTRALAELLAREWADQSDELDPKSLPLRDLADYAIDIVALEPVKVRNNLIAFAETDTLSFRAKPDEPLYKRQQEMWDPILAQIEAAHGIVLPLTSGIAHKPLGDEAVSALTSLLSACDNFTLAALEMLGSLAASCAIALSALSESYNPDALFAAANLEEDFQAEEWGWDSEAETARNNKQEAFVRAFDFLKALKS